RRRVIVALQVWIKNGKHGNFLGVGAGGSRLSTHLRSVEITVQILGPIGVASIGKVVRGRGCWILRLAHLNPLYARAGRRRRLLPRIERWQSLGSSCVPRRII